MMKANPLFDVDFLTKLTMKREREIFARITALTMDELPVEYIEGKVTAGSINIDGASAVRRTCNLTMVAQDVNINEFYWGFKRKFILEVGVKNTIDSKYPDIIWFKQGVFVITSFNTSQTTNNFTCTINGKDKMCLLNGDIAGHLPHSTDFGVEEYLDKETNTITYTKIPIKQIIREALLAFGNELAQNIVINDLDDAGLELLEYRGNTPMYMFKETTSDQFYQMTFNGNQTCYLGGAQTTINDPDIVYDNLVKLDTEEKQPSVITFSNDENAKTYHIVKFEYGQTSGYRLTDLVFAGDLIANVGETLTSVFDKIKNMLGDFEYFYNIDGKFVFQKKQNYLQTTWHIGENNPEIVVDNAINTSFPVFSFMNAELITSFANTPNILNVRNDFSVWGTYKSISGADLPIHMRLALDTKPTYYKSPYGNGEFTTEDWDWRELIYQMALDWRKHGHDDDFLLDVAAANPNHYPTGKTGYEQYYIDLEGYWRQLYDPNPEMDTVDIYYEDIATILANDGHVLIKNPYRKYNEETDGGFTPEEMYILQVDVQKYQETMQEMYDTLTEIDQNYRDGAYESELEYQNAIEEAKEYYYKKLNAQNTKKMYPLTKCGLIKLTPGETYYYKNSDDTFNAGTTDSEVLNAISISLVYIKNEDGTYVPFVDTIIQEIMETHKNELYVKMDKCMSIGDIDDDIKHLYQDDDGNYLRHTKYYLFDNFGEPITSQEYLDTNCYVEGFYTFDPETHWSDTIEESPETLLFWFDFLETEGGELAKFSVPVIGSRTKAINDSAVKTIYYRDIPTTIFTSLSDSVEYEKMPTGYTYINLPSEMESLFSISSKGKSAQERMDELLQAHSYCIESTTIQTVPVYHLEPNTRVYMRDDVSGVDGEYIVTKLTIPLAYNGTMSLTTTKVVANIM